MWKELHITSDTGGVCLYIVLENVCQIMYVLWSNYTQILPRYCCYCMSRLLWVNGIAFKKRQGWWCFRPPLWTSVLKDRWGQYWLCSKLRKKLLHVINYRYCKDTYCKDTQIMCFINKLTQVMCFINMQASQRHEPSDTQIWYKFKVADFSNIGIALCSK